MYFVGENKMTKQPQMSKERKAEIEKLIRNAEIDAWLDDNVHKHEPEERK